VFTLPSQQPQANPMPAPSPPIQLNHPRIPLLARATGLTLVVVFALLVLAAALPFNPRSIAWAAQLASRIVDATSLGFVGVALLRFGTLLEPEPDLAAGRREALRWARRRNQALGLARLGVIGLALLAIGQIPLFMLSVNDLDRQASARSSQLSQRLAQTEQLIRQAPVGQIQQHWQRLNPATAPALSDPQAQRQALLNLAENQQQQAGVSVQKRADQLRFELVRNSLRTLLIALAYLAGFRVLCGRSV
jgi:hypothetical protein